MGGQPSQAFDAHRLFGQQRYDGVTPGVPGAYQVDLAQLVRGGQATPRELARQAAAGIAAHRPARAAILGVTDSLTTLRHLKMVRSVEPYLLQPFGDPEKTIERAIESLKVQGRIHTGDRLVIVSDVQSRDRRIDSIQLRTVG